MTSLSPHIPQDVLQDIMERLDLLDHISERVRRAQDDGELGADALADIREMLAGYGYDVGADDYE